MNIGIRRAAGPVVVLLDTSVEPTGDLDARRSSPRSTNRSVAVTGGWGITSQDLRQFEDAPAGDVDAIEGYCQAFRRADYAERGPLDERFRFYRNLDIWWSLVLRDGRARRPARTAPPRRAVRLDGLPAVRHDHRGWTQPARGGARPPVAAELLPDHRPIRRPDRPAGRRSGDGQAAVAVMVRRRPRPARRGAPRRSSAGRAGRPAAR